MVQAWFMIHNVSDVHQPNKPDECEIVDVDYLKSIGVTYLKIKKYGEEHIHSTDQIRYVSDGSGYYDVRDNSDRWIRLLVEPGDFIIIPAGMYHRSVTDENDFLVTVRIFPDEPVYDQFSRPADQLPARKQYLQGIRKFYA